VQEGRKTRKLARLWGQKYGTTPTIHSYETRKRRKRTTPKRGVRKR